MKILQLVNRIPYPLNDGGNLAVHFYTEGFLNAGVSLSMLAMNTTKHWVSPDKLPEIFSRLTYFHSVKVDTRIRLLPAFLNLFSQKSYNISRFISKNFEQALIKLLQQHSFDIIQLEGLYLMPYMGIIRQFSKAKVVLRQHNAEFVIWERLAQQADNPFRKNYLSLLARRLKTFENQSLNQVDLIVPISSTDAAVFRQLGARKPMFVQSFGFNMAHLPFIPQAQPPLSLYHIGAMDWLPNKEGILFFINQVMPLISEKCPELQLHLAGRNMPEYFLKNQWPNVIVHGEVPDATVFERDKSILVVPLLSGGGVRIKVFRAMALGKAIVSTSVGVEGINVIDSRDAIVADTAEEMAEKIIRLVNNPKAVLALGQNARQLVEKQYNQSKMIGELLQVYQDLIATS